ncbi:hypothetical protein BDF20DRAFT_910548 [Mycotypha africana]|uniref:uncharacterized protein n=1 Tax=Mycotypha africana TaxID=64632 RepID=UPI0023007AE2|nr:uncharacterized protein BDF20DRAFT_910548 [Mycotypha africana]KAI8988000.1 hypothetical protein BDF20DRAFT_910548 [Mycotypha africana]
MPFVSTLKESFAIAPIKDREHILKKVTTPNTDEARYYEGLILLQKIYDEVMKESVPERPRMATETEAELAASMRDLLKKFITKNKQFGELNTRFHLLIYPFDTKTSTDFIKKELQLDLSTFETSDSIESQLTACSDTSTSNHPSKLNSCIIDGLELVTKKLKQARPNDYLDIEPFAFPHLRSIWDTLNNEQQVILLKKVFDCCPTSEQVFGTDIMHYLTKLWKLQHENTTLNNWKLEELPFYNFSLQQMDYLIHEISHIVFSHKHFVTAYLNKLAPAEFDDVSVNISFWDDEDNVLRNYLDRLDIFVGQLPSAYVELKLAVKFHTLRMSLVRREFNEEALLDYLTITSSASASVSPVPSRNLFGNAFANNSNNNLGSPFSNTAENSDPIVIPLLGSSSIPASDRKSVLREYLAGLIEQDKLTMSIDTLGSFGDYHDFLKPLYAELMLTTAKSNIGVEQYINTLGQRRYEALVNESYISFTPSTLYASVKRKPSDNIELRLRSKNIPRLSIRVYQIETEEYWRLHSNDDENAELEDSKKINLDGLCPNFEKDIDLSDEPAIHVKSSLFEFGPNGLASDVFKGRGMWVIEFVGGQHQCRSIVQKGYLRKMEQSTAAGHLFKLIDEENNCLKEAKIWYNNQYYEADKETGDILIPYLTNAENPKRSKVILISCADNFSEPASIYHLTEQYDFDAKFYLNNEMVYPNKSATVVTVPDLRLNGVIIPLNLLEKEITLTVDSSTITGVKNSMKCQQAITDFNCISFDFAVPNQLALLEFTLKASIKTLSGKMQDLKCHHQIHFDSASKTSGLAGSFNLEQLKDNKYILRVLGKNGESKKNHEVSIRLKHEFVSEPINAYLKTDAFGAIYLGELAHIQTITCTDSHNIFKVWDLTDSSKQQLPIDICVPANTAFKLSCVTSYPDCLYSLHETGAQQFLVKNMTSYIKKGRDYLEVDGLPEGSYIFYIPSTTTAVNSVKCTVIQSSVSFSKLWSKWLLNETVYGQYSSALRTPLHIQATTISDNSVDIQLDHFSPHTFAVVTATTFVPPTNESWRLQRDSNMIQPMSRLSANDNCRANMISTRNICLDDKRISEEYQYILNRSRAEKWVGNNLSKPSLLMYPKKNADTVTKERYLEKGATLKNRMTASATPEAVQMSYGYEPNAMYLCGVDGGDYNRFDNSLNFLSHQSPVLIVPVDRNTGKITIDRSLLGIDARLLRVLIISGQQSLYQLQVLESPNTSLKTKDLRQPSTNNKPLIRSKTIFKLIPNERLLLQTHEYEVIDSFEKLFDIVKNISDVGELFIDKFYFLRNWSLLSVDEKLSLHEKHVCHEFNLWLKKKDYSFFEKWVKPALKSKVQKSFMDKYLIDEDLTEYCQNIHQINQLSIAEKALLASSIGSETICTSISKFFKGIMDDRHFEERADAIFDSILAHGGPKAPDDLTDVQSDYENAQSLDEATLLNTNVSRTKNVVHMSQPTSYAFGSASLAFSQPQPPPPPAPTAPGARALFGQSRSANIASSASFTSPSSEAVVFEAEDGDDEEEVKQAELLLREKAKEQQKKISYTYMKSTTEYKETGFYDDNNKVTAVKQFWIDYLEYHAQKNVTEQSNLFLSESFMYSLDSVAEILYVLSLMDLPFASETDWKAEMVTNKVDKTEEKTTVSISTFKHPVIVFYRSLKQMEEESTADGNQSLMIGQEFFIVEENVPIDSNECIKLNPLQTAFEPLLEYGNHLIISNASSKSITCQVTVQIPSGSIPTQIADYCKSKTVSIEAYSTWHEVMSTFYFPETGHYHIPPVTVSTVSGDDLLRMVHGFDIEVKSPQRSEEVIATPNSMSWASIAKYGSLPSVLSFLDSYSKLDKLDLGLLQWRMTDKESARQIIDSLRSRYMYRRDLWQYGILHQFTDVLRELLLFESSYLLNRTGYIFESPIVSTSSASIYEEEDYQNKLGTLDYYPMLHARIHPLKPTSHEILNQQFYAQYNRFLEYLTQKSTAISAADSLMLTLYLLLQDRVGEARSVYACIQPENAAEDVKVQYDYLGAYLKTCVPTTMDIQTLDLKSVKDIAKQYMGNFGVLQWRQRFTDLYNFVCEVEQGYLAISSQANLNNERVRSEEPILELEIDERQRQLLIQYNAHVKSVQIKYYEMDIEVMFSNNPFMNHGSARKNENNFLWIKPSKCTVIDIPEDQAEDEEDGHEEDRYDMIGVGQIHSLHTLKIPFEGGNKNVFVEVSYGSLKRRQVYYANNIYAHVSEAFGVVRVINKETKRPMMGAYVKVYARLKEGKQVHFWKDGYTGLNGVFDYVSVTEGNNLIGRRNDGDLRTLMLDKIDKLSILVLTAEAGAVVKEVYPPLNG